MSYVTTLLHLCVCVFVCLAAFKYIENAFGFLNLYLSICLSLSLCVSILLHTHWFVLIDAIPRCFIVMLTLKCILKIITITAHGLHKTYIIYILCYFSISHCLLCPCLSSPLLRPTLSLCVFFSFIIDVRKHMHKIDGISLSISVWRWSAGSLSHLL